MVCAVATLVRDRRTINHPTTLIPMRTFRKDGENSSSAPEGKTQIDVGSALIPPRSIRMDYRSLLILTLSIAYVDQRGSIR